MANSAAAKKLIPESDGRYLIINVLSRRAKELARTGKATIPYAEGNFDPVEVAREEFLAGKLAIMKRDETTGEITKFE